MSHIPRGLIGHRKLALKFLCGDAFLIRTDHIDCEKPLSERHVRVVEYSAHCNRELGVTVRAIVQVAFLASLAFGLKLMDSVTFALRADAAKSVRPADLLEVSNASLFRRKLVDDLENGRLSFVRLVLFGLLHDYSMEHS